MKVTVNEDKCFGCGGCIAQMDTIFDFNDDGHAYVKKEELNNEEKEQIKEFVDNSYCPGDAIQYEELNNEEKEQIKEFVDNSYCPGDAIQYEELNNEEKEQIKEFVDNSYCPGDAIQYEE